MCYSDLFCLTLEATERNRSVSLRCHTISQSTVVAPSPAFDIAIQHCAGMIFSC